MVKKLNYIALYLKHNDQIVVRQNTVKKTSTKTYLIVEGKDKHKKIFVNKSINDILKVDREGREFLVADSQEQLKEFMKHYQNYKINLYKNILNEDYVELKDTIDTFLSYSRIYHFDMDRFVIQRICDRGKRVVDFIFIDPRTATVKYNKDFAKENDVFRIEKTFENFKIETICTQMSTHNS